MVLSQFCTFTVVKLISITSPSALLLGMTIQSPIFTMRLDINCIPATNPRIESLNTSISTADTAPSPASNAIGLFSIRILMMIMITAQ